jgi:hypothetical protein
VQPNTTRYEEDMTKLNQIIALTAGKKSRAAKATTEAYHQLQKPTLLDGISRTYLPKDEEGDTFPPESKLVQLKVKDVLTKVKVELVELFDVVATQDTGNCSAKADVKVDNVVILEKVPVTYLLFLEKQLTDIGTLVEKLPVLDPADTWKYDAGKDCYASEPFKTSKTKKVMKSHEKSPATKEHPAQVDTYHEDVVAGNWTTTKFSGAIEAKEKNETLDRVRKLQEGVKCAREEANSMDVAPVKFGNKVLEFIFKK